MGENTNIEWADHSWNPWRGCTKVSPGCAYCYAEALSKRNPNVLGKWGKGAPRVVAKKWNDPIKWNRESEGKNCCKGCGRIGLSKTWREDILTESQNAVACCPDNAPLPYRPKVFPSLCDWLDEEVPIKWLEQFLQLIHDTPNIDWLLLTKRPESFHHRITSAACSGYQMELSPWMNEWAIKKTPPANVWIGTSVEDQTRADARIPALLKIPAKRRFLSVEPLIGPVSFDHYGQSKLHGVCTMCVPYNCEFHGSSELLRNATCNQRIDWVIVGGESGPSSRPCNVDWIRSIVSQCATAGVPCFVKQLGAKPVYTAAGIEFRSEDGLDNVRANWNDPKWFIPWNSEHNGAPKVTHPKGGDPEEWPADLRVRQFPEVKP